MTPGEWRLLRLKRPREGAYFRVDGAEDVVAVVKREDDAVAIEALPRVIAALQRWVDFAKSVDHSRKVCAAAGCMYCDTEAALAAVRGEQP